MGTTLSGRASFPIAARLAAIVARAMRLARRHADWLALAACIALTAALYGRALAFPFFYDDTFDLSRTESQSFLSLLHGIHGYAYYRPVPFLLWKALYQLQGRYDPVVLHAISLATHALAGWVLYLLVARLTCSRWAILPALLFIAFPDSYQVVPVAGSLFHSLVALLVLATLELYLRGRTAPSSAAMVAALVTLALALWTHEYGVLALGYLVLLEGLLLVLRWVRRPSPWLLAHLALGGFFLAVWTTVAKAPSPVPANRAELIQKGLFFLQGMAYPATAWLVPLQDRFGHDLAQRTLLAGGLALALGALAFFTGRKALIGVVAVLWSLIALLPVWWRLNWPYVENAPRLLYLAAAGAAVFWGMLVSLRWPSRTLTTAWRAAGLAVVGLVLLQSAGFIGVRMDMLRYGGQLVDGVAAAGAAHAGGSVLFMNVPSWFVQHQQDYARGHLGVTMMPSYIGLDRVIYTETGARVRAASLGYRADTEHWRYGWQPHGASATAEQVDAAIRAADEVYVADMAPDRLTIRSAGRLEHGPAGGGTAIATLAGGVDVLSATVQGTSGVLRLDLQWQVRAPVAGETQVVVQLRDRTGVIGGEWRGYAMNDLWAPRLWRAGDRIDDRAVLRLPRPAVPGPYTVWLGLVSGDGRPLPAAASDGHASDGSLVRVGEVPE